MPAKLAEIIIQKDTRENLGWIFPEEDKKPGKVRILGTETAKLDQGDYCILGHPDLVVIERKMGFRELFGNMCPKEHKERFEKEMVRLDKVKYKYLLIEANINQDILGFCPPQMGYGPPAKRVVEWIYSLQREYGIIPIWAGDCGHSVAKMIFKDIARLEL